MAEHNYSSSGSTLRLADLLSSVSLTPSANDAPEDDTPLHSAARSEKSDSEVEWTIGELLHGGGCSVTAVNWSNETPIHVAAKSRNWHALRLLVDELMRNTQHLENIVDSEGLSLFHIVCSMPNPEHAATFVDRTLPPIDARVYPDSEFQPGYTALHFAAAAYRYETVQLLLERGANARTTTCRGWTVFHLICSQPEYSWLAHEITRDVVQLADREFACSRFLENLDRMFESRLSLATIFASMGLNSVNARDADGNTALMLLAGTGANAFPLAYGVQKLTGIDEADPHFRAVQDQYLRYNSFLGWTMLEMGDLDLLENVVFDVRGRNAMEFVVGLKPDLSGLDRGFGTLLHHAVTSGKIHDAHAAWAFFGSKSTELERLVDVNAQDKLGNTAFHYVYLLGERSRAERLALVQMLLGIGADLSVENEEGASCYALVRDDVIRLIKENKLEEERSPVLSVWEHLQSLLVCEYYRNPEYGDFIDAIGQQLFGNEDEVIQSITRLADCEEEVERLKWLRVSDEMSLHDFMVKDIDEAAMDTDSEQLREIVKLCTGPRDERSESFYVFPIYEAALKSRFVRALRRRRYLDDARRALDSLIGENLLPLCCLVNVLCYLSDYKLRDLVEAGAGIARVSNE